MLTKTAPQYLALSVKIAIGNSDLHNRQQAWFTTWHVAFDAQKKQQQKFCELGGCTCESRSGATVYMQDLKTNWCYNRIKIVLYPETPAFDLSILF